MSDEIDRDELNALPVEPPAVHLELEHFFVCEICGQAVDKRKLGDVIHHITPAHDRLATQ